MHQGSCLCGSIRYSIDDPLKRIVNCHCRFCSKAHGAPFVTLLFMPFANFRLTAGAELLLSYEVKAINALRSFCSRCGTRLYNHAPAAGMISLVVATLDGGAKLQPVAHINTEARCTWYRINDGLPEFPAYPDRAAFEQLFRP